MAKRKRMSEDELASAVSGQIDDAKSYDGSDRAKHREWALRFFEGEVDIEPMGKYRSSVVSRDVADTHGLILPGLLRIFFSSSRIVHYEPTRPEHEEYADLASDLVNYVVMAECDGYKQFRAAFSDGLLLGNGIVKHWWDDTPEYSTDTFSGLTREAYQLVVNEPDVEEVIDEEEYDDPDFAMPTVEDLAGMAASQGIDMSTIDPVALMTQLPPPPKLYDFTVKRLKSNGRLCLKALPPEEFWIERAATGLDESVRFCAHVQRKTRSELIKEGYSRAKVDKIPLAGDRDVDTERHARDDKNLFEDVAPDASTEKVDIYECYILMDTDGDGIAERRRVVMGGHAGKRAILANEEWGDDLPFSDIVPEPVPHRWRGRGLYDEMGDIQRINTVLMRGCLDNTYKVLVPQRYAWLGSVENPDELMNPTFGGTVWLKSTAQQPPVDAKTDFIVPQILPVIEYMNGVGEKRTGVSMRSQAMDLDALQNQSATAVNAAQAAAHSKVEEYARNIAECGGMRRVFACCLRLITKHQDRAKTVRLAGKLVEIDPRSWNSDMDVTINTGLGTGSRERDLTILSGIAQKQEQMIQMGGPFNPILGIKQLFETYQKMTEAGGVRNPEAFFPTITDEQIETLKQQQSQQGQQPNPQMIAMQQKLQMDEAKMQADIEMDRARMQTKIKAEAEERQAKSAANAAQMELDAQLKRDEAAARIQALRDEAAAKMQMLSEETAARIQIEREKMDMQHQERMRELQFEAELAAMRNASNVVPDTNIPRPE